MRNFIIGFITACLLLGGLEAIARSTDISAEPLWNRVFDSSTNTISIIGQ